MRVEPTSSYRTLIECMNYFVANSPVSASINLNIADQKVTLSLVKEGKTIFEIKDCPNLQSAYEELLMWIIDKSDIANR